MHERIQMSLLIRKRAEGYLAFCFHSFLEVFEGAIMQKISCLDSKEWLIKDG